MGAAEQGGGLPQPRGHLPGQPPVQARGRGYLISGYHKYLDIYSLYTRLDVRAAGDTEVIIQLSQVTRATVLPRSEVHSPT